MQIRNSSEKKKKNSSPGPGGYTLILLPPLKKRSNDNYKLYPTKHIYIYVYYMHVYYMHISSYIHTFRKNFQFPSWKQKSIHPDSSQQYPLNKSVLLSSAQIANLDLLGRDVEKTLRTYSPKMVKHGDEADGRIHKKISFNKQKPRFPYL